MTKRIFIDVREPYEFERDHVDGAINLPPADLLAGAPQLEGVDKDTELVLYCLSGARSNASMTYLKRMGYTNLVNGINKDHIRRKYKI
jgi:rhodanese-related sulfurtransferase